MGLDVSLQHYPGGFKVAEPAMEAYEKATEEMYEKFSSLDRESKEYKKAREEYDAECTRLQGEFGFGEYGGCPRVEHDSTIHPEHMFKLIYWRSSYNSGGYNTILGTMGLPSLYDIVPEAQGEDYYVVPDWQAAFERALEAKEQFAKYLADNGDFQVIDVGFNPFVDPTTLPNGRKAAMDIFQEERKRIEAAREAGNDPLKAFSNRHGSFYFDEEPLGVRALIPGIGGMGAPTVFVVLDQSTPAEGEEAEPNWYQQGLDVVAEGLKWVLDQDNIEDYFMGWSG